MTKKNASLFLTSCFQRTENDSFYYSRNVRQSLRRQGTGKKIIKTAKDIGADAVKIQTYTADTITLNCRNPEFKVSETKLWNDKYLYDLYQEASTPWEWQAELKEYADKIRIPLFQRRLILQPLIFWKR